MGGRKIQDEARGMGERRKGDRKRTVELRMGISIEESAKLI